MIFYKGMSPFFLQSPKDGRFLNRGFGFLLQSSRQNLVPSDKFFNGSNKKMKPFGFHFSKGNNWNLSVRFPVIFWGSLRSCPLPIIPLSLSREEGMIHFFVGSHVKKPESGLFSDWIGNNTDDLRCSNWPKCCHPLVVVDFSLHFCLRHEQWIHTRVRYKISAGSVFLNLKNA